MTRLTIFIFTLLIILAGPGIKRKIIINFEKGAT
jgi:hypothetical protein